MSKIKNCWTCGKDECEDYIKTKCFNYEKWQPKKLIKYDYWDDYKNWVKQLKRGLLEEIK